MVSVYLYYSGSPFYPFQHRKDYKNIDIKVNFYKGNNLLGSYDSKIDHTKDGKCTLKFTKGLKEEPDTFYYDVMNATEV